MFVLEWRKLETKEIHWFWNLHVSFAVDNREVLLLGFNYLKLRRFYVNELCPCLFPWVQAHPLEHWYPQRAHFPEGN